MTSAERGASAAIAPSPAPPGDSLPNASRPKARMMRKGRLDRRGKVILSVAAATAVLANAGAAWAYWTLQGDGNAVSVAGRAVELKLQGHSDDSKHLFPGGTTNLSVTVTNQNDFAVKITSLSRGSGTVTADPQHRSGGCRDTGVAVVQAVIDVSWQVPKNTIGVFTVPDGLKMNNNSDSACQGATFTIPIRAVGVSDAS